MTLFTRVEGYVRNSYYFLLIKAYLNYLNKIK